MDIIKLRPILNKESILKTANARELGQAPQDVLERYTNYALTHVPLGDTTRQLKNLERVIIENKHCAVGAIVGPYGYGKTSTAVHLWNELREQKILAIPPFLWVNLSELMDAVYYWIRFEFSQGPKAFIDPLEKSYESYCQSYKDEIFRKIDPDVAQDLIERGALLLEIRPDDVVAFFSEASDICEQAGYNGMAIFTDELQATLAQYKPSRDEFFAHLFQIVKDIQGLEGNWALIISINDDTEGILTLRRSDILARLQRSALYFRVQDVYNRREYPTELWSAFEQRFVFDGKAVISTCTLDSIGQVAARTDLGAGPRMVTQALALAVKSYEKTGQAYTPMQFVDDFLTGLVLFDQQGKFPTAVKKALDNDLVRSSETNKQVIKLMAAYPMGCSETTLAEFELLEAFQALPSLARMELIVQLAGGPTLRYLAEEVVVSENIAHRLTNEFASRFSPGKVYASRAAEGLLSQVITTPAFAGWKGDNPREIDVNGTKYLSVHLQGSFESSHPDRVVSVLVAALPQSPIPFWKRSYEKADIELRFELNFSVLSSEPSRLIVSPDCPDIAIFQLNAMGINHSEASKILPKFLFEYYTPERWNSLLTLSLMDHLFKNRGDLPEEQNRINAVIQPLRQYTLLVLLGEQLEAISSEFESSMVGLDRIKDLVKKQCQQLYPSYKTLITNSKWQNNLQQYTHALQRIISQGELSIARGRRSWKASKEVVADTFAIPGRRLTNVEPLLESLKDLIVKEEFSGRAASSEVTLRFRLHPLEEEWLKQLDGSQETVKRNGLDVPSIPAELLLREAKKEGYTDLETMEILRLLKERGFIELDRHNLITRTVDAVDDLRDAVLEQVKNLEEQIRVLVDALPDFDASPFPVGKLHSELAEAKERDQIEAVKAEVRQYNSTINSFAASRTAKLRENIRDEQENLHKLVRQGVPPWLKNVFDQSPLEDLLEKQRRDLASDYQAILEEISQLYQISISTTHSIQGPPTQLLVSTYAALHDLTSQSKKLTTRRESYQDRQEDFEVWRRISKAAADVNAEAYNAYQVYANGEFKTAVDQLWALLRGRFEAQPLTFLGSHKTVSNEIEVQRQRIMQWLESRREEFDFKLQSYQQLLADSGIRAELRVPFDKEKPIESQAALMTLVKDSLDRHFSVLYSNLKNSLQIIHYSIQVQGLKISNLEARTYEALQLATKLREQIRIEIISDQNSFQSSVLRHLVLLAEEEKKLEEEVQQAIQLRPAAGSELKLMKLFQSNGFGQEVDLRELIMRLIDQREGTVDLSALMHDLESLFQKNLVDVHIKLSGSER
ncbi:MAG: hypothetical protein ACJ8DI_24215 [Ktedonobacteraceae bacterium]